MSNIVIDESRILQLEEDRVTLRNNLRSQGLACKDDETLESLVAKVNNLQSWVKLQSKTLSGAIYDDTLTSCPSFYGCGNITSICLEKVTVFYQGTNSTSTNGVNPFRDCSGLKTVILPSCPQGQDASFFGSTNSVEKVVMPRITSHVSNFFVTDNTVLRLFDLGSKDTINGGVKLNAKPNFKYLILRKSDGITTLDNTSRLSGSSPLTFVPQAQISNYEGGTNWSATSCTFLALEGSRFEDLDWWEDVYNTDGTPKNTCTLDGNLIETADNETVAIFKHTENISHCYENGVELQDTDLVKGKTLTSTI